MIPKLVHSSPVRLIDSPLIDAASRRDDLVRRMAADLVAADAFRNKRDAINCLFGCRVYHSVDIAHLLDDARQTAMQTVVAAEMGNG